MRIKIQRKENFFEIKMGNNASRFTCQICEKILYDPVLLPCKCNLCKEHLNGLFQMNKADITFNCKICKININLSQNELKENVELNQELELNVYLSKSLKEFKAKLDSKLDEINAHIIYVNEMKQNEFPIKIYDHFYSLMNDIDIKREMVLQNLYSRYNKDEETLREREEKEIQQNSANLIEQIEITEKEFRKNLNMKLNSYLNKINLNELRKKQIEIFRAPNLTKKEIKKLKTEYDNKLKNMKTLFAKINLEFETKLKENAFKEKQSNLGNLIMNDFNIKSSIQGKSEIFTRPKMLFQSLIRKMCWLTKYNPLNSLMSVRLLTRQFQSAYK